MFSEAIDVIRLALSNEKFSYSGNRYQYENTTMRPRPRDARALLHSMCFSWGTPTSAPVGARHGLKPLIIPQKAFEAYHADLETFAQAAAEAGHPASRPRIHLHMYCHEDAAVAEEVARRHIPEYVDSAMRNYELKSDHFEKLRGYEHYRDISKIINDEMMTAAWVSNCIWGTPEMCVEKIRALCDAFHPEELMLTGRYGAMPGEVAANSIELFAREVLPAAQAIPLEDPITYERAAA
jgi:alkanesulfonate monooxygenase SsuD/methylene tetrahydromethanopterin reductase-like flavin-dependent oxidoreductase (luciferase family)